MMSNAYSLIFNSADLIWALEEAILQTKSLIPWFVLGPLGWPPLKMSTTFSTKGFTQIAKRQVVSQNYIVVTAYMYSIRTYLSIGRQSSSNLPHLGSKNLKPPVRHLVSTIKYHAPFRRGSLWSSIFPILPTTDLNDPDPRAFCFTAEVRIRRSPCPNPWTCQPRHPPPIASTQ